MSKRSELVNIFKTYQIEYEQVKDEIKRIRENKSRAYSDEGIRMMLNDTTNRFSNISIQYRDRAISIIDDGIKMLENKWKENSVGRLNDSSYQIGLANTIKMIETGSISNREDFKNIIDAYKNDYNALAIIKNLVNADGDKLALIDLLPSDTREYNKKILRDLKNNINRFINPLNIDDDYVELSLISMREFVENKFDENLEVMNS